ncbi:hypothetical protein [Chitinimonas sp. BJB300]|uniref:hypothetical protein n=1 Tax=Chitinimonas sp. BJB300 TaxID=1559339 RepID=UPI000C0DD161|nr:hypothetical protein [Chitinimonas sp. BJB300]PHV13403.1 hypothetical protein CSQ89_00525 [Chitinimonas sp. BJB300]TSJ89723.1 hypothetical protein FG002_005745 [Chitinimonas sp. BJB300]
MNERSQGVLLGCVLSLLLHGLLFWLWPTQRMGVRQKSVSLEVALRSLPAVDQPAQPIYIDPPRPEKPIAPKAIKPSQVHRRTEPQVVLQAKPSQPSDDLPSEKVVNEAPSAPLLSLTERALAGVKAADQTVRAEQGGQRDLLAVPTQHRNLFKLSPSLQTALARSFENELAELVILEKTESQEGSDRVTKIRTNKGTYCLREMLVKPAYLRGMVTVPRFGGCGP